MKSPLLLSAALLSAGFALSLSPARADDPANPPTPPSTPAAPDAAPADGTQAPPPGHHRHMRPAFLLADLTEKLGLTPGQQKTIGAIIAGAETQGKALREDDSLSRDERRQKMKAIMDATRSQIRAALTPEQQKTFDALPKGGERGEKPPAPTPTPTSP